MAKPITAKFGKMVIKIDNGADPEVLAAPCGFTSKSLKPSKNLTDVTIPDYDDPDAPSWIARDVESLTASVSGDGILAAGAVETWRDFFDSTDSRSVEITVRQELSRI